MTSSTINLQRFVVKVAGESGQGINSVGEILAKSSKESGYYVFATREYPSLIKGGYACYQIDISDQEIKASSQFTDLLICLSRFSVHAYLKTIRPGGALIHALKAMNFTAEEQDWIKANNVTVEYIDADQIALAAGGKLIMANTVMIGVLLQLLGLSKNVVSRVLTEEFAKKPQLLDANLACLDKGYQYQLTAVQKPTLTFVHQPSLDNAYLMTGNHALALGAIAAGVRVYYAYPMTPSSSVLTYLANWSHETGMLVKQVEDEISVAQMTIGSMFMGTRALCGTSGGGFDLMTESLSMAGMTETPWVCILGQRPGPATGLPTWTSTGDLNLAIYSGHGEYSRAVLAASDVTSAYRLIQEAFNLAEKFQTAVIVLTEKQIAESLFLVEKMPEDVPINRSLLSEAELAQVQATDRYADSPTGVSKRWFPGQSPVVFDANGDEHLADGSLTEEAAPVKVMYDKRMRKHTTMLTELPEPIYFGPADADVIMVGWGSVKNTVLDVAKIMEKAEKPVKIGYLHYEYVYPLRTDKLKELMQTKADKLVLIENNYLGQLGQLIAQETGFHFSRRLLKYDGRPFFIEDVIEYVKL